MINNMENQFEKIVEMANINNKWDDSNRTQRYFLEPIFCGNQNIRMVSFMVNVAWGNQYLLELLEIMQRYNCNVTFFLEGTWAHMYPHLAKAIRDAGHEIGNHAYSHADMRGLTEEYIIWELRNTNAVIFKELGIKPSLFTPPYATYNERIVKIVAQEGMKTVLSSIDTQDWNTNNPDEIINKVNSDLKNGSIILMHPTEVIINTLPTIIKNIEKHGVRIGKISDIIS
ncbi:polysaccharide deacetylase family protein [Bacillus paramycoides]|uniref:polysaccharide deacetylase family protein n=1 Tax=Bacillus paramycoides TaxID=2026194 RepID=UPI003D04FCA6